MARLSLVMLFLFNVLVANECNQAAFELREKGLAAEIRLYDKSIHIARQMYINNTLIITKAHYESDMKSLENRLANLTQSKKYLFKAMRTNLENTEKWKFLATVCGAEHLEKIEKELIYAQNAKEGMQKVAKEIDKMIETTKIVIDIGKKSGGIFKKVLCNHINQRLIVCDL